MDHFELDAFGLDRPSEASVAAVDAEFELLLELCPGKEGGVGYGLMLFLQRAGVTWCPRITRGVCILDHAGLVFLSFFLGPVKRQASSGPGAWPGTPAQPTSHPDGVAPLFRWLPTYHIGIGEIKPNEDIQIAGGQPCGQTQVTAGQRWSPGPWPLPGAPSPGGVGKLMHFTMNRSMSLLLRSGKILPGGQVGRQRHLNLTARPPSPSQG